MAEKEKPEDGHSSMAMRGVSRPQMGGGEHDGSGMKMSREDRTSPAKRLLRFQ